MIIRRATAAAAVVVKCAADKKKLLSERPSKAFVIERYMLLTRTMLCVADLINTFFIFLLQSALANGTLLPEHADDFERMLIAQPNSSFLWVQYMAFHLQSAAIDAARAVASRALRTIDYREEDVRRNIINK